MTKENIESKRQDLLKNHMRRIKDLTLFLIRNYNLDLSSKDLDDVALQWMLRAKTILQMRHICEAFYRGSLFYNSDINHFAHSEKSHYVSTSTIESLVPDYYLRNGVKILVSNSYMINDHNNDPYAILSQLLFNRTSFECNGSTQLPYYFNIKDLLIERYGDEIGVKYFNKLFGAKLDEEHNLNRLRIGLMGNYFTPDPQDFSPLYYFITAYRGISLEGLIKNPDLYLGLKLGIGGQKDYSLKHPAGSGQGWNAIFVGLNLKNEPLFLVAREVGQDYLLTYDEIIKLTNYEFDRLPESQKRKFASLESNASNTGGLLDYAIEFSMDKIKLLLTDFDLCLSEVKKFCDDYYNKFYKTAGLTPLPTTYSYPYYKSKNIIRETQDDIYIDTPRFFHAKNRKDPLNPIIQDDAKLHISYRKSAS